MGEDTFQSRHIAGTWTALNKEAALDRIPFYRPSDGPPRAGEFVSLWVETCTAPVRVVDADGAEVVRIDPPGGAVGYQHQDGYQIEREPGTTGRLAWLLNSGAPRLR